jgi:Na+-transporting methylmalonyl-CoA/oxaloacetate decarboxylase gamma subunit
MEILQALGIVLGALLVLAAAVNTIGSAFEKFSKMRRAAKAPNDEQNNRLDNLETQVKKHDNLLDEDNDRLKNIEQGNRVTQRALLGLLDHGIDGNSIERMQKSRKELENYLIEK